MVKRILVQIFEYSFEPYCICILYQLKQGLDPVSELESTLFVHAFGYTKHAFCDFLCVTF